VNAQAAARGAWGVLGWGLLSLATAACSAGGQAAPGDPKSGGGGSASGVGGSDSGGSSSPSAGSSGLSVGDLAKTCGTSAVGHPQLRRLTRSELQNTLDDIFPQVKGKWSVGFSEVKSLKLGLDNDPALLTVGGQVAEQLLDTADALATALTAADVLPNVLPCAASSPNRACAQTFLNDYGRRLFRRPLSQADQDRYLTFFDARLAASDFKSALRWMTIGLIQSPHAIYRREVGALSGGEYQLTQHEIATELAYMYTGSTPSADLLAQADAGQLKTPEQLVTLAQQLLATPAGQENLQRFFRLWLGYDQVPPSLPNAEGYDAAAPTLVQETRKFIEEIVVNQHGGTSALLTAPFSTPAQATATSFYKGWPAPSADYAMVTRPTGQGLGVLAQASVIAAHSHEKSSSPTLRGLLVFERLLCGTRPQVPANVPTLVEPSPGVKTTRQRYEQQHMAAGTACPACHQSFDPIGFGFEHFDEAGRYRDTESGLPIDSSGSLKQNGQVVFSFQGLDDLATNLAQQPGVGACTSGYIGAYAYANSESCLAETRRAEFISGSIGFLDYIASLAGEPSFTRRK
jgi:hypothetical protein